MLGPLLSFACFLSLAAPDGVERGAAGTSDAPLVRSRLAVMADAGLVAAFFTMPAMDLAVFVAGSVPAVQRRRPTHWLAFGVRSTLSLIEVPISINAEPHAVALHLHAALSGAAGRRGRFAYSAGVGPVFGLRPRHPEYVGPNAWLGLDGEARLGFLFGTHRATRAVGVVGGMFRLTGALGHQFGPGVPIPSFGLFVGVMLRPIR